jgi:hypothetical protein
MIDLLAKVLDGRLSSSEALSLWPDIDEPSDNKLMQSAWHSLYHYDIDADIRAKEPEYETRQVTALVEILEELKNEDGKQFRTDKTA